MPRIQFKATQGATFTPLPKGAYDMLIEKVEPRTAKASNNPQLRIIMRVQGGEYDNRECSDFITLDPEGKSGWRLGNLLEGAIPGEYDEVETAEKNDKGKPIFAYDFDTDDLIGVMVRVNVTIRANDRGEDQNDFRYVAKTKEVGADGPAQPNAPTQPAAAPAATGPAAAPATAATSRQRLRS